MPRTRILYVVLYLFRCNGSQKTQFSRTNYFGDLLNLVCSNKKRILPRTEFHQPSGKRGNVTHCNRHCLCITLSARYLAGCSHRYCFHISLVAFDTLPNIFVERFSKMTWDYWSAA